MPLGLREQPPDPLSAYLRFTLYQDEGDRAALRELADKSTFASPGTPTTGLQHYDLEGAGVRARRRRKKLKKAAGDPAMEKSTMDHYLKLFIPITKVDAARRLVYGVATAEKPDIAGEMCDYASTKPLYQKWSEGFAKTTDGKSLGNLRAMHGNVAAGKLVEIVFNDEAKQVEICGKVVDDAEWQKVEEGVYTGFSQGGRYLKRWPDPENPSLMRYTAEPLEVSLVDHPCLPEATFSVIKADGTTELRKFKPAAVATAANPEDGDWEQVWISKRLPGKEFTTKAALRQALVDLDAEEAANKQAAPVLDALAAKLAKAGGDADAAAGKTKTDPPAGDGGALGKKDYSADERKQGAKEGWAKKDGSYPIKTATDVGNAVKDWFRSKGSASDKRHIVKQAKKVGKAGTDMLPADWPGSTQGKKADKLAGDGDLAKAGSFSGVGRLVMLLGEIEWMEEDAEAPAWGFGVNLPKALCDRFGAALVEIGDIAAEMLDAVLTGIRAEEASEAVANAVRVLDFVKLATGTWALAKAGARHSKADKDRIKQLHDGLVDLDSDCCPAGDGEDEAEKLAKGLQAKLDASEKAFAKTLGDIMVLVKQIADQPMPMGSTSVRVVEKAQDFGNWAEKLGAASQGDDLERLAAIAQKLALTAGR